MKKTPSLILVFAAAAVLLLSVFAFKRYLPYTGTSLTPSKPPSVILSMENTYLVGVGEKGKLWSVKAKKVEIGQNRSYATVKNISDGKIFSNGKTVLKVKAGKAICDTYNKDLRLGGGVVVEGLDGQKVAGDGATWNSTSSTLRSRGKVNYQSKLGTISTDQLNINLENKEMNMQNIRMKIFVDKIEAQTNPGAEKNAQ